METKGKDPAQTDLVPARMLSEYAYCPRLGVLMWAEGEFEASADVVEGRTVHKRVSRETGAVPAPPGADVSGDGTPYAPPAGRRTLGEDADAARDGEPYAPPAGRGHPQPNAVGSDDRAIEAAREAASPPEADDAAETFHARSLWLSAEREGLTARVDLLEGEGTRVTPVEYKKGRRPDVAGGAWEPERVQVCAQMLVLRENGFTCDAGVLYFAGSRERVRVPFTDELAERTRALRDAFRADAEAGALPPPLKDSPKCPRCALVGICLPDETIFLQEPDRVDPDDVRRLYPARDDALPLYIQEQGAQVAKRGEEVEIRVRGETVERVRLLDVSQVSVFGNAQVTTQLIHALCERGIPLCYFSTGGWFHGVTHGMTHKNVRRRIAQYGAAFDEAASLRIARLLVKGKVANGRTLIRRNHPNPPRGGLRELASLASRAGRATDNESLLGIEGAAGRLYWDLFPALLKPPGGGMPFAMDGRNRRPPRDPVNALLSYAYALLAKDVSVTLLAVGFDPFLGFYHRPRYGRPSLALDLMEEFRPLVADSAVLTAVNTGVVSEGDFIFRAGAVSIQPRARTRFIQAYERRMDTLVSHPLFGYRVSYRRILEVQARLLGRYLDGEIPSYPAFRTR
ncbi:MAG: CRISPR-associated endonuclease Cas1 [Acidobacteria bacterium]|nr:CRISPR-associated endonuclease Cas1 [Acidobacteriota bacterium]